MARCYPRSKYSRGSAVEGQGGDALLIKGAQCCLCRTMVLVGHGRAPLQLSEHTCEKRTESRCRTPSSGPVGLTHNRAFSPQQDTHSIFLPKPPALALIPRISLTAVRRSCCHKAQRAGASSSCVSRATGLLAEQGVTNAADACRH